jgi:hypothetical protein
MAMPTNQTQERQTKRFIAGTTEEDETQQVNVRFNKGLLQRLDATAKRRGLKRSMLIQLAVERMLEKGED